MADARRHPGWLEPATTRSSHPGRGGLAAEGIRHLKHRSPGAIRPGHRGCSHPGVTRQPMIIGVLQHTWTTRISTLSGRSCHVGTHYREVGRPAAWSPFRLARRRGSQKSQYDRSCHGGIVVPCLWKPKLDGSDGLSSETSFSQYVVWRPRDFRLR